MNEKGNKDNGLGRCCTDPGESLGGVGGCVCAHVCVCGGGGWDLEKLTLQDSRLVGISRRLALRILPPIPMPFSLLAFPSILQVSEGRSLTQGLVVLYPRSIKKIKMDFKQDRHTFHSP